MLLREGSQMSSLKPGDWIEITYTSIYHMKPFITKYISDELINSKFIKSIKLWQPKVGEWCWFWNKDMDTNQSPRLAQFHLMTEELQKPMDFPAFYQTKYKATKLGYLYDFCEPFIGQLPTSLKDQS